MAGRDGIGFGEGVGQVECPYMTIAVGEIERLHADGEGLTLALHRTSQQIFETMYDAERGADINASVDDIPDHVVNPVVELVTRRTEQMAEMTKIDGTSFALIDALDT